MEWIKVSDENRWNLQGKEYFELVKIDSSDDDDYFHYQWYVRVWNADHSFKVSIIVADEGITMDEIDYDNPEIVTLSSNILQSSNDTVNKFMWLVEGL